MVICITSIINLPAHFYPFFDVVNMACFDQLHHHYLIYPVPPAVHIIFPTISSPTRPSVSVRTASQAPSLQIAESAILASLLVGGRPLINQLVPHLPDLLPPGPTVRTLLVRTAWPIDPSLLVLWAELVKVLLPGATLHPPSPALLRPRRHRCRSSGPHPNRMCCLWVTRTLPVRGETPSLQKRE